MFAARTQWPMEMNEFARRVRARREEGRPLLDLTESNPTRCALEYPQEAVLRPFLSPENMRYDPSPRGARAAREAIAEYYAEKGVPIDPDRIILTASTSEAYTFLLRLLADPGDRILVPRPSYPLFEFLADLNDVRLDAYRLVYREGWRIDVEDVAEAIQPTTRALIVVNPNNPTGSFVTWEEWQRLRRICRDHGVAVISDEVFLDYAYTEHPARSDASCGDLGSVENPASESRVGTVLRVAEGSDVLTFVLGGISKLLGLPQMKLAWIGVAGPKEAVRAALGRLEIIADTYLSVSTPVQQALPQWMALRSELSGRLRERVEANRRVLVEQLAESRTCRVLEAEGGWYAILQLLPARDDEAVALELMEHEGVLVHPGYLFDFEQEGYLVLSLLPPEAVFREGVQRIRDHLERG